MKEGIKLEDKKIIKLVMTAMFASLVCVATMIIKIQTVTNGYINLGDSMVLLSGWMLGPVYGVAAAAVGSCLADILAGYPVYALATFLIKGIVALIAFLVYKKRNYILAVISAVTGELFMAVSYFVFDYFIMGYGKGAIISFPANIIQGVVGAILALLFLKMIQNNKTLREYFKI